MRKDATFLVAAALLHAGIPLVARLVIHPSSASLVATTPLQPIEMVEIPIEPLQEPPSANVEPRAPSDAPEPRTAAVANPREPSGPVEPSAGPEPAATAAPNVPPGRAPDQYDALPEGNGDGIARAPGLGSPIWMLPGAIDPAPRAAAAPTVAPSARPVDKDIAGIVVREAMLANDKRLGLDLPGAGTVASAVGTAVRGTETPSVGRATFEIRLSADGRVLGVRIVSATAGASDAWDRAAKAAAAALASRTLQMNANYAKGAMIYVDVSSTLALPSGGTSGVSQEGSGLRFDVSDIGAHKSRSVKTSFRTVAVR